MTHYSENLISPSIPEVENGVDLSGKIRGKSLHEEKCTLSYHGNDSAAVYNRPQKLVPRVTTHIYLLIICTGVIGTSGAGSSTPNLDLIHSQYNIPIP